MCVCVTVCRFDRSGLAIEARVILARGYTGTSNVTCETQRKSLSEDELDRTMIRVNRQWQDE